MIALLFFHFVDHFAFLNFSLVFLLFHLLNVFLNRSALFLNFLVLLSFDGVKGFFSGF